jgi:hypothetical protein
VTRSGRAPRSPPPPPPEFLSSGWLAPSLLLLPPPAVAQGALAMRCTGSYGMLALGRWSQCLAKANWFTTSPRAIWNR